MHPRTSILATLLLGALLSSQSPAFGSEISPDLSPVVPNDTIKLPAGWRFVGGRWSVKPLARHDANRQATTAVVSKHHVAFPGICKTRKGTLLVVYREGFTHASGRPEDGRVMLVRSHDLGKTWGKPELVYDDPTMDDRNAAVSCMNDGTICVIFDKYLNKNGHRQHHWAWLLTSTDEGRTWSEPVKVSKTENVHTRSRALDLGGNSGNGKWLIPYSESTNTPTASCFFAIYDPKAGKFDEIAATPHGQRNLADETSVTMTADGRLVALIRSNVDPQLFQTTSDDDGRTWSKAVMCGIPSQFTPADLITLDDGRLVASFSFRDRRDERLVVSRDGGKTWDVENSLEVFDGTRGIGGDRSYTASVQLDKDTIATVLYETNPHPKGGKILFVTNKIAQFDASKQNALYQGDSTADATFALWPTATENSPQGFEYRFTGKFAAPPNVVGLLLDVKDAKNYTSLEYQMGSPTSRSSSNINVVKLVKCVDGKLTASNTQKAAGDWFQDGNPHRMAVEARGDEWLLKIDGHPQFSIPKSTGKPRGIITRRAAVAVTGLVSPKYGNREHLR